MCNQRVLVKVHALCQHSAPAYNAVDYSKGFVFLLLVLIQKVACVGVTEYAGINSCPSLYVVMWQHFKNKFMDE